MSASNYDYPKSNLEFLNTIIIIMLVLYSYSPIFNQLIYLNVVLEYL